MVWSSGRLRTTPIVRSGNSQPLEPADSTPESLPFAPRAPSICDFCREDSDFIFKVAVDVYTVEGLRMRGKSSCEICIAEQGFTGWSYARGGWPVRDARPAFGRTRSRASALRMPAVHARPLSEGKQRRSTIEALVRPS